MKKMTKKWDFETSNAETEPKIRIYAKNWARQVMLKYFDLVKVNGLVKSTVNEWRVMTWQACVARGGRVSWHVRDTNGAWSACSWGRNFSCRMGARVRWFLAVLGWVLLGIVCSVTLCLCFDSWMSRMMRSESCWDCGHDSGDSLLTVTTGWRRGQRKNARDVHGTRKSEEWLWYHVNNIKCERKTE